MHIQGLMQRGMHIQGLMQRGMHVQGLMQRGTQAGSVSSLSLAATTSVPYVDTTVGPNSPPKHLDERIHRVPNVMRMGAQHMQPSPFELCA